MWLEKTTHSQREPKERLEDPPDRRELDARSGGVRRHRVGNFNLVSQAGTARGACETEALGIKAQKA